MILALNISLQWSISHYREETHYYCMWRLEFTWWCLVEAWWTPHCEPDFKTTLQTLHTGWSDSLYLQISKETNVTDPNNLLSGIAGELFTLPNERRIYAGFFLPGVEFRAIHRLRLRLSIHRFESISSHKQTLNPHKTVRNSPFSLFSFTGRVDPSRVWTFVLILRR